MSSDERIRHSSCIGCPHGSAGRRLHPSTASTTRITAMITTLAVLLNSIVASHGFTIIGTPPIIPPTHHRTTHRMTSSDDAPPPEAPTSFNLNESPPIKPPPPPPSSTSGANFDSTTSDPIIRNDLTSQFSRWIFLQSILNDELDEEMRSDVHLVLFRVLRSFLDAHKRRVAEGHPDDEYNDDNDDDDDDSKSAPHLTDEQIALLETQLLADVDEEGRGIIRVLPVHDTSEDGYTDDAALVHTFASLDKLQPDEDEDGEAYKCAWDIVVSLYGEESTKLEMEGGAATTSWTVRSGIVRLLIHYQFLYHGVKDDDVSSD